MAQKLFHLIAQAKQNLFRSANQVFLDQLNVSGTQIVALFIIEKNQGCALKDLANYLQLKNAAITGLVARMEGNALITKKISTIDRRSSCLYLTDKGRAILVNAAPLLAAMNTQLTADFSATEITTIARFLTHAITLSFTTEY